MRWVKLADKIRILAIDSICHRAIYLSKDNYDPSQIAKVLSITADDAGDLRYINLRHNSIAKSVSLLNLLFFKTR
jgi:hypothetical protein